MNGNDMIFPTSIGAYNNLPNGMPIADAGASNYNPLMQQQPLYYMPQAPDATQQMMMQQAMHNNGNMPQAPWQRQGYNRSGRGSPRVMAPTNMLNGSPTAQSFGMPFPGMVPPFPYANPGPGSYVQAPGFAQSPFPYPNMGMF
jgi:hypothetical protein